jgi:S-adenosylmethionine:tRNA ribosyltransferase-isomerase
MLTAMRTDDLDFDLPPNLIAQSPAVERAESRLLHYRRGSGEIKHLQFRDLPGLLKPSDLVVFNDARVIPARFGLRKVTGGFIEGLFLRELEPGRWTVMLRNAGARIQGPLAFEGNEKAPARIEENLGAGEYVLRVSESGPAEKLLDRVGRMPLPPYIKRDKQRDDRDELDRARYQTVYASSPGAVAAPTAGLHFTPELLAEMDRRGIERIMVTLHVGAGTFKPVTADDLAEHRMHSERYSISAVAAEALNRAEKEGRRIVAVGTTAARVLESQVEGEPFWRRDGETSIFIYPPYRWRHVGAMVTNFHLPRSTLIALVAAMTGLEEQRRIYAEAIAQHYRFFSYGDAMFID